MVEGKKKIKKKSSFEQIFSDPKNFAFFQELRNIKKSKEKFEKFEREKVSKMESDIPKSSPSPRSRFSRFADITEEEKDGIEKEEKKKFSTVTTKKARFKMWNFANYAEQRLWIDVNNLGRQVEFEFKFVRYPELFLGFGRKAVNNFDNFTEESLIYDAESLDDYFAVLEDSSDLDMELDFSQKFVYEMLMF